MRTFMWPWSAACLFIPLMAAAAEYPVLRGFVPQDLPVGEAVPLALPVRPGNWTQTPIRARVSVQGGAAVTVPAQYDQATDDTFGRVWLLWKPSEQDRGKPVRVEILRAQAAGEVAYRTKFDDPIVTVRTPSGGEVFSYYHGAAQPGLLPPLTDYIHPLFGLDGEVLTDLRPRDHLHHRGVFWAWVRHERDGRSLGDWWHPVQMRLEPLSVRLDDGPVFTWISPRHHWTTLSSSGGEPHAFVEERVNMRVFPATAHGRAIDLDITLVALEDGIRFGGTLELKKGYGGLTIRFGPARQPQIYADNRRHEKDLNHLRARWVDWSAIMLGNAAASAPAGESRPPARSGAAILIHPSHPDAPPEWITRNYGVIGLAYPGLNMLELPEGKPLHMRYRIWVHRGPAPEGRVDEAYRVYAADWKWDADAMRPGGE